MTDTITLTGIVATPPKAMKTTSGISICTFRLASSHRRFDRSRDEWVETETNWYTVTTFRHLADNVAESLGKGEHVVVLGRLRIRSWENGERSGTTVEVDAEAIGHDLLWGRTQITRMPPLRAASPGSGAGGRGGAGTSADVHEGGAGGHESVDGDDALHNDFAADRGQDPANTPPTDAPPPTDPARPLGPTGWPDTAAQGAASPSSLSRSASSSSPSAAPATPARSLGRSSGASTTVGAGAAGQDAWLASVEAPF